jgi:hypothetical protein
VEEEYTSSEEEEQEEGKTSQKKSVKVSDTTRPLAGPGSSGPSDVKESKSPENEDD